MIRIDFSEENIEVRTEQVPDPLARVVTCRLGDLRDRIALYRRGGTGAAHSLTESAAATSHGNLGGEMRIADWDLREEGRYIITTAFRGARQPRDIVLNLEPSPAEAGLILRMTVDPLSTSAYWLIDDEPVRHVQGTGFTREFRLYLEVNERLGTITVPEVPRRTMWDRLDGDDE